MRLSAIDWSSSNNFSSLKPDKISPLIFVPSRHLNGLKGWRILSKVESRPESARKNPEKERKYTRIKRLTIACFAKNS